VWNALAQGKKTQSVSLQVLPGLSNVPTNRLTSVTNYGVATTYTYDKAGNLTSDASGIMYGYDVASRLVSATQQSAMYGYDTANRRTKKSVTSGSTTTTHYIWDGEHVIAEYNASGGAPLREYIYAGEKMVARIEGSTTRYFHADRLSTRLITDTAGVIKGLQYNHPFGEDAGTSGTETQKHRFTSYERDGETATDYAMNRQYRSTTGRYSRPDPLPGSPRHPQTYNRYSYTANDPINYIDPSGLLRICFGNHVYIDRFNLATGQIVSTTYVGFQVDFCISIPDGFSAPLRDKDARQFQNVKNQLSTLSKQCLEFLASKGITAEQVQSALAAINPFDANRSTISSRDFGYAENKPLKDVIGGLFGLTGHKAIIRPDRNGSIRDKGPGSRSVYFRTSWFDGIDRPTVLHEALHITTNLYDKKLAEKLGITLDKKDDDVDASRKITNILRDNGCFDDPKN
jgi:RHS repeat-associated protein